MDFYYTPDSTPCRAVILTANAFGIDMNMKRIRLNKGEHMTPEFLKMNPQHSLPTMVDDGLTLIESKAMVIYLADKYAKSDALYPRCPCARANIHQRLLFDASLYSNYTRYYWPHIFMKVPEDPQMISSTESSFELFEKLLDGMEYVASCHLTIADLVLVTTVATFEAVGFDVSKYPNVWKWYQLVQSTMPGLEVHNAGVDALKATLP